MKSQTVLTVATALLGTAGALHAQPYPSRFITLIVPYAAGGTAEVVGRPLANEMAKTLGQNVVIELRPGAGGNIGAELVAKSARPDGYTLLFASLSLATNVSLMKLNFDPRKDLTAAAGVATFPNLLVVGADAPVKSVSELIALAKQKPGVINFGSSGPGTSSHLSGELFKAAAGIDILHVPYKGSGAVYPDLIGGRINMLFDLMGSAIGFVQGGKVRAIATTSRRRSQSLPDVPTIAESGFPGFEFGAWLGTFAPAGTPRDAISRIEQATLQALQNPTLKERFAQMAAEPIPVPAAEFGRFFNDDVERFARLVREGKLAPLQ
jgi:tripartite-type tricarboxylate transporter receptor subunit TctC